MVFNTNKEDLYFTDEDYDTFSIKYQELNTKEVRDRRDVVKQKLLDINPEILELLKEHNISLYNHPDSKRHTTSLTTPCEFNKGKVNWLGIRYGKSPKMLKEMNMYLDKDDKKLGFQKYACMQINVCYTGVEVGIYHSVPRDAQDRLVLRNEITKSEFQDKLFKEIENIQGYGFKWCIWNPLENKEYVFDFDTREPQEFVKFYLDNDTDGCYSSMMLQMPRYDYRLTKDRIVNTCFEIMKQLWDIYRVLSWQPNI